MVISKEASSRRGLGRRLNYIHYFIFPTPHARFNFNNSLDVLVDEVDEKERGALGSNYVIYSYDGTLLDSRRLSFTRSLTS